MWRDVCFVLIVSKNMENVCGGDVMICFYCVGVGECAKCECGDVLFVLIVLAKCFFLVGCFCLIFKNNPFTSISFNFF